MTHADVAQLELLAQVDDMVEQLSAWADLDSPWRPLNRTTALIKRLLSRVERLRLRLEAPLVVATFGGTGTGKSTLVNALVGSDCTATGRERPTTRMPVLILHPETESDALGLNVEEFQVVRIDAPLLRDIVLIDCPDPDTNESESSGNNLERLHDLLPHCDVLIYTTTQQKYRSARVVEELGQASTGCRLLFVQTHADVDEDIRSDWQSQLEEHYNVPDLYFVDSVAARNAQRNGIRPTGDFARLVEVLNRELSQSQRVRIRRANLIDLIHEALQHCRNQLTRQWPPIEQLEAALEEERHKLTAAMTSQLSEELSTGRYLWERRLLTTVTENWGFSPFSSMLRLYNGIGSLIASMTLFRARSSLQVALLGALQGARWLKSRQSEQETDSRLQQLSTFGVDDDLLRESQFVMAGYVNSAQLDPELTDSSSLDQMRSTAVEVEGNFLNDAGRRIDEIINRVAQRNSKIHVRVWYELLFLTYIGFVVFRIGKNFFYDTFLRQFVETTPGVSEPLLSIDFYISAGLFFLLWSGLLVMAFTSRLRRGLTREVTDLSEQLAQQRMSRGLFPQLEQVCRKITLSRNRLETLADDAAQLRRKVAMSSQLGAPLPAGDESVSVVAERASKK